LNVKPRPVVAELAIQFVNRFSRLSRCQKLRRMVAALQGRSD